MAKSTNPAFAPITAQITPAQLQLLQDFFDTKDAADMARTLRSVCISAITSDSHNRDNIAYMLNPADAIEDISRVNFKPRKVK